MNDSLVFLRSTQRHPGCSESDAINAIDNAEYYGNPFDRSRNPEMTDTIAWIGPNLNNEMIEVFGAYSLHPDDNPETIFVFHCMKARPKTLTKIKQRTKRPPAKPRSH